MKAKLELELRELLEKMKSFQNTIDFARKEEPKNMDYIYLEVILEGWVKHLATIIVTHKR